jgi:hypothetical protein
LHSVVYCRNYKTDVALYDHLHSTVYSTVARCIDFN